MKRASFLLLSYILLSTVALAQFGNNANWHFGDSIQLNFNNPTPTTESCSIQTPGNTESASFSNELGLTVCYSDGNRAYNSDGAIIGNSEFSNSAQENLITNFPGIDDKYLLFRSSSSFGVDYSIIDFSSNPLGEIDNSEKEIVFQNHDSELLIASHPNNVDYWLIVLDNQSGSGGVIEINVYLINSSGLTLNSTFSNNFTFAGFYSNLDDARISPTCQKIATSHKGHYITLFDFDNELGEITDFTNQSVSLPDFFGTSQLNYLAFSETGMYLYVLQDHYFVTRFETQITDPATFLNSGQQVIWNDTINWSHIKRGPNNNIYLLNETSQSLDYIENTEGLIDEVLFIQDSILIEESATFFPNTFSSCQSPQFIEAYDTCEGWSANLSAFGYEYSDSLFWDVEIPGSSDTLFISSSANLNGLLPGTYPLVFNYLIDTIWYQIEDTIEVFSQPFVDFGPDQTLCDGVVLTLEAGPSEYNYSWIDGSHEPTLEVSEPGPYAVIVSNGPCVASDEINIDFIYEPQIDLIDTVFCFEEEFIYLNAFDEHADSYLWNDGSIADSLLVTEEGVYTVQASNSCFTVNESSNVEYVIIPDLLDDKYEVCGTELLQVSSSYSLGEIIWSNGDFGPVAEIENEGGFVVTVEDRGCFKVDQFEVERIPFMSLDDIIFPNVFSANEDDWNRSFRPFSLNQPDFNPCEIETFETDISIYNRWGLELGNNECNWFADDISPGTYFYVAEIISVCLDKKQEKTLKGSVTLIR